MKTLAVLLIVLFTLTGCSKPVSVTTLTINLNYDQSVLNSPLKSQIESAVNKAAQIIESNYTNPISITIDVGWGEENNNSLCGSCLGQSQYTELNNTLSLNTIEQLLSNKSLSLYDKTAYDNFPQSIPGNNAGITLAMAQGKALGIISGQPSTTIFNAPDGFIGFNSSYSYTFDDTNGVIPGTYDLTGIAIHEMTEVMGRCSGVGSSQTNVADLFRYSSKGVISFSGGSSAYFSIDGGATDLNDYNVNPTGDSGDWSGLNINDALNAFTSDSVSVVFTQVDKILLNVIGYTTVSSSYTESLRNESRINMFNLKNGVRISNVLETKGR